MAAALTWIDLTAADRDRVRRVLDLFEEQGTRNELGLATLRDALATALFPGTSTLQTRLRYTLFVPWIYQELARRRIPAEQVEQEARKWEVDLIEPLLSNEDGNGGGLVEGVIGAQSRGALQRLPSSIYWPLLVRWGIFRRSQGQSWFHRRFADLLREAGRTERADDPGVVWSREPVWHPRLPKPPEDFPQSASLALTSEEAAFLQGRILERCRGTALARLASGPSDLPDSGLWNASELRAADDSIGATVELARRFSLHVEGAPLLYNLLLSERFRDIHGGGDERIDEYRSEIDRWAGEEERELPFDPHALWNFTTDRGVRTPWTQRRFVESWSERLATTGLHLVADSTPLRVLIENRERQLKGHRARLSNAARLRDWNGRAGVGRMGFRWFRVRRLLLDLHQGLRA